MLDFSRVDRSVLGEWWWTVDRLLLVSILALVSAGLIFTMAASTPVAIKLGLGEFHFVKRQAVFVVIGLCLMIGTSLLRARHLRRISLVVLLGGFALMLFSLSSGDEIKGARRWVNVLGFSLQPSEFVKPAFVLISAWLFAERSIRPNLPAMPIAGVLFALFLTLLLAQPDVGQAALVSLIWGSLCFVSGIPVIFMLGFVTLCTAGGVSAYLFIPHVTLRVDRFLDPDSGDNYQVDKALESIMHGGWFGLGPGEGEIKRFLPDSHTDFVFAAVAEEFGIIACFILIGAFAFIVLRSLFLATHQSDRCARFAVASLGIMFGLQSLINIGVNLALLPAKGMTLPFISSGGSSMLASFFAMGMVLGLTRYCVGDGNLFPISGTAEDVR